MLRRLIPQEFDFFTCFEKAAEHAVQAAKLLQRMTDADPLAREIESVEHACDDVTHSALDRLNKVFITPIDREDIHLILMRLDDVVDLIHATSSRLAFLAIEKPTPHSINMAKQIVRGCEKMAEAVHGIRLTKNYEQVTRDCIAVHEVENAADDILHYALAELFTNIKDPITVIKWKDIYESLEEVTDRLEAVANALHGVIVKMS